MKPTSIYSSKPVAIRYYIYANEYNTRPKILNIQRTFKPPLRTAMYYPAW